MSSELRWTLLILGLLFIAALAWWERHRPRQASGRTGEGPVRREPSPEPAPRAWRAPREALQSLPEMRARDVALSHELPVLEAEVELPPVLAPAPPEAAARGAAAPPRPASSPPAPAAPAPPPLAGPVARESLPQLPPAAAPVVEWPPDTQRRIVALRLVAPMPERFAGRSLRQALAAEGFVLGRFAIFHKADEEQRAVLSAASLTRPGTFDHETMDSQHYGGLSLFAVLPGPKAPPQAFDDLLYTAHSLNDRLHGELQDEQGSPLTPARIALLRERLGGAVS